MKIAIDIDGTITRYPTIFNQILQQYPTAIILTGHLGPIGMIDIALQKNRKKQLQPLIGNTQHTIHICIAPTPQGVAEQKAYYCKNNQIDLLIDDDPNYCRTVRKISPNTAVLMVMP